MKHVLAVVTVFALTACAQEAPPQVVETAPPTLEAVTLPLADQAGNRMEALTQDGARWCSSGGAWCVTPEDAKLTVTRSEGASATIAAPAEGWTLWPNIVTSADTALIGIVVTDEEMYSGGSALVRHLVLYDIATGAAREALRLPYEGSADIRACFDADDEQARAGACRDQYVFVTRVRMDETVTSGAPRIVLETAAASFPGRITRQQDSGDRGPLTEADLVWAPDDVCTYRRTFVRNEAAGGAYAPDAELPACADYLEP